MLLVPGLGCERARLRKTARLGDSVVDGVGESAGRHRQGVVESTQTSADGSNRGRRFGLPSRHNRHLAGHCLGQEPRAAVVAAFVDHDGNGRELNRPPHAGCLAGEVDGDARRNPLHEMAVVDFSDFHRHATQVVGPDGTDWSAGRDLIDDERHGDWRVRRPGEKHTRQ